MQFKLFRVVGGSSNFDETLGYSHVEVRRRGNLFNEGPTYRMVFEHPSSETVISGQDTAEEVYKLRIDQTAPILTPLFSMKFRLAHPSNFEAGSDQAAAWEKAESVWDQKYGVLTSKEGSPADLQSRLNS